MASSNGRPQPWDPAKVRTSVDGARRLVEALSADESGDAYRVELEAVLDRALAGAETEKAVAERLAYVIYGLTIFGIGGVSIAEALGNVDRAQVMAYLDRGLGAWLAANS